MAAQTIESLCQAAKQRIGQGDIEEARDLYLQALELRSDAPDVHYGLATVCYILNDLESAAYHFKEVTRLDPLRAGAYVNLGAVYNRLEQYDDAIQALRRGIQIDPQRAEGYYNLAVVYRKQGQPNLAVQAYLEATRINPRMVDAHYNLANLYLEMSRHQLAILHYKQVLQLRPNWDKAQEALSIAQAAHGADVKPAEGAKAEPSKDSPSKPRPADDLHRTLDPNIDGVLLTNLHKATIESEKHGRQFMQILEQEIEPAIKELSAVLLTPDASNMDLDHCVQQFESAIQNMRSAHEGLQGSMDRVRHIGDKLAKNGKAISDKQ